MAKCLTTKTALASDAPSYSADQSLERQDTVFTSARERQTRKAEKEGTIKLASNKENRKGNPISSELESEKALKVETLSRDYEEFKHDCAATLPTKGSYALDTLENPDPMSKTADIDKESEMSQLPTGGLQKLFLAVPPPPAGVVDNDLPSSSQAMLSEEGGRSTHTSLQPSLQPKVSAASDVPDYDEKKAQPVLSSLRKNLTTATLSEATDISTVSNESVSVSSSTAHKLHADAPSSSPSNTAAPKSTHIGTSISSPNKGTTSTLTKGTLTKGTPPTKGTKSTTSTKGSTPIKGSTKGTNPNKGTTSTKGTTCTSTKGTTSPKGTFPTKSTASTKGTTSTKGTSFTKGTTATKGSIPTKDTSTSSSSIPDICKSPFLCSCGRNFETRRGLSIHLAHEPGHNHVDKISSDNAFSSSSSTCVAIPPSMCKEETRTLQDGDPDDSDSAPSSPPPSTTNAATPSSPTLFNMASFKTSSRNPHYYSIIRTRRASNITEGGGGEDSSSLVEPTAAKRPRTSNSRSSLEPASTSSPTRAALRSSDGEKATGEREDDVSDTASRSSSVDPGNKRRSREISEQKTYSGQSRPLQPYMEGGGSNISPSNPCAKKSPVVEKTGAMGEISGSGFASSLQELALRNSPITRSNAASLKTHEFISLPTRKNKGGKRGGGGWRGGWRGGGRGAGAKCVSKRDASSEENLSEEVGEDFESPTDVKSTLKETVRSSSRRESSKVTASSTVTASTTATAATSTSNKSLDLSSDTVQVQPQKRRRGRPPKVRPIIPSNLPSEGVSKVEANKPSPSLPFSPVSGLTRSGKVHSHASKANTATTSSANIDGEEHAEESPLPKSSTTVAVSSSTSSSKSSMLPSWDSFRKDGEKRATKPESADSKSLSAIPNVLPKLCTVKNKDAGSGFAFSNDSHLLASEKIHTSPASGKGHSVKRALSEEGKGDPVPKKQQKRKKSSSITFSKVTKFKKEEEMAVAEKKAPLVSMSADAIKVAEGEKEDGAKTKSADKRMDISCLPPPQSPVPAKGESRIKLKGCKTTPKLKSPAKSGKGKSRKKSHSETEELDTDVSVDSESKFEGKKDNVRAKESEESSSMPTAQIPVSQQRQSSVFVSVLSGPPDKPQQQQHSQTAEQPSCSNSNDSSALSTKDRTAAIGGKVMEKDSRPPDQSQPRLSETAPSFSYPSSSPTTPTYPQFPYQTPFAPPPHHMLYHPSGHPSAAMYPPFYGYPGTQPMQIPPPPHGTFLPPPHPMNVPHPGPSAQSTCGGGGGSGEQNPTSPHGLQVQQQQQLQQQLQQQQQVSFNSQGSQVVPISTSSVVTSAATTVGGVRVSVMEKPITQLPMVTLPYHMPSATPPRGPHPPPGAGGYPAMELPSVMRGFVAGPGGPHSPDGIDTRQHMHAHPLSQVYRPGITGMYHPPPHLHPPYPSLAIRMDPMSFIDWTHEPRPPPPEENPVQPVKCPECNRMFKNNKALNGHMRLHGGFDWTKKHPFSSNSSSSDGNKQQQQSGNGASTSSTNTSSPNEDAKSTDNKATPPPIATSNKTSSQSRKRSRSDSRSRSQSPMPSLLAKAKGSKRKKSVDDGSAVGPSGLTKEVATANLSTATNSEVSTTTDAVADILANLPVPRGPSIFTFDPNSPHAGGASHPTPPPPPHKNTSLSIKVSSSADSIPASELVGVGGALLHTGSTLDDLCRAAAELERMDTTGSRGKKHDDNDYQSGEEIEDEFGRKRPKNITILKTQNSGMAIERERYRLGTTPPYTPPPILSPSRSVMHLAPWVGPVNMSAPCTPNRILQHWSSRRSTDSRNISDTEESTSFSEPRINVGEGFQAKLPECDESRANVAQDDPRSLLMWKPFESLMQEDESVMEGFLELACSPSVCHGGRNKELAIHFLHALGGSIKEAVRWLLSGKTLFDSNSPMVGYKYCGSNCWSGRERQQFRRAWKVHRKQFNMLRSAVESKRFADVIEYYYTWKKYCSDEYRGRNRHVSEEIFSDEDDIYAQIPSSSSSGSGDSELANSHHEEAIKASCGKKNGEKYSGSVGKGANGSSTGIGNQLLIGRKTPLSSYSLQTQYKSSVSTNLPIMYAPHSSPPVSISQQIHQFPCKYPRCNQVFTSIFALNGHIRIHGGSFYPKASGQPSSNHHSSSAGGLYLPTPSCIPNSHSTLNSHLAHSSSHFTVPLQQKLHAQHHMSKSLVELELAKTLLDLPGQSCASSSSSSSSSASKGKRYHTPSPKPSPGKGKTSGFKKKMSSSSPGEREDFFPCNKCGRIFTKVKSRSAHMKSHIIKSN